jgi:hypothetical protein
MSARRGKPTLTTFAGCSGVSAAANGWHTAARGRSPSLLGAFLLHVRAAGVDEIGTHAALVKQEAEHAFSYATTEDRPHSYGTDVRLGERV